MMNRRFLMLMVAGGIVSACGLASNAADAPQDEQGEELRRHRDAGADAHVTPPLPPPPVVDAGSRSAWAGPTNTGYQNAPGYPGSLTPWPGGPIESNKTYRFYDFPDGLSIPAEVHDTTFYGCRFTSNAVDDANVADYGENITFDYDTFMPSRVSSAPPPDKPLAHNLGYQYGIDQRWGVSTLTVDHSDFWGFANAIELAGSSQAKPVVIRNTWMHDARDAGGTDHTDGILENYGGPGVQYLVTDHNTISSLGATNAIALQGNQYSNLVVTNNYVSGFGVTVSVGHKTNVNVVFTGNTLGTDIQPYWYPTYYWTDSPNNVWKCNKLHVVKDGAWGVSSGGEFNYVPKLADEGKFWLPSDTFGSTDYRGNTACP